MTQTTAAMTHRERITAALRGEPTDRPPIALWRHFPREDDASQRLAAATVRFQRQFDLDLVKLMPTGMYPVIDYGVEVRGSDDDIGTTRFVSGPIKDPADWTRLRPAKPDQGVLRREAETVRLVRQELGAETPVIQTIFSPLQMAAKLIGGVDPLLQAIAEQESLVRDGLEQMTEDVIAFGRACLDAGVDGFFFATQVANRTDLPEGIYQRLGVPFDRQVLDPLRADSWCTIIHLHGIDPLFDLADAYPIDGVNWHDRETAPTLSEGLNQTRRALVAGIERRGAITNGTPEQVTAEVRDAIAQTAGRRLIVAPGCVIPYAAPVENLLAARRAVEPGS